MTKQDYAMRLAFLGITSRQVADMMGCSPSKLSDSVSGAVHMPSMIALRAKADELTMRLMNEKRREMMPAIEEGARAVGVDGEIEVVMPADSRVVVLSDGALVGYFDTNTRSFRRV